MNSPFSQILDGSDRTLLIAETDFFFAILEKSPLSPGHAVILSKRQEDDFFDLNNEELTEIMPFAKRLSAALRKTIPCRKVGISVIGLETRHAHLHLVPIHSANDLNFTRPKLSPSPDELMSLLNQIKSHLI